MKYIAILLSFVLVLNLSGQSIHEIRSKFHAAVLDSDESQDFHHLLTNVENPNSTIKAYQAVSEVLLSQVVWNPFTKLSQIFKYDKLMAVAVKEDPKNVEIRFLRLAIEYNLPSFLGMSTHLRDDVDEIVSNLSSVPQMQINPMFGKYIFYFIKKTNLCGNEQLERMRQSFDQGVAVVEAEGK